MKYTLFLISLLLTVACASVKNKNGETLTAIDYKIKEKRKYKDTVWEHYHKMKPGIEKSITLKNIQAHENPNPSFYTLKLNDSISKLVFHKPMYREDGKSFHSYSSPLSRIAYRFVDSTGAFIDYSQQIPHSFQKTKDKQLTWVDGKKDSIILNIKTHLMIGTNPDIKVKAWTTQKFPPNLGIFNVSYENVFILAYEIYNNNPKKIVKSHSLKIYPQKIKQTHHGFSVPEWNRELSQKEIEAYYKKLNEKIN